MKNNSQNASDWRRGATSVRWRTHSIIAIVNTDFSLNNNFRHMNHMNPPCVWPFEQKFNCESVELIDTFVNKKLTFADQLYVSWPVVQNCKLFSHWGIHEYFSTSVYLSVRNSVASLYMLQANYLKVRNRKILSKEESLYAKSSKIRTCIKWLVRFLFP